MGNKIITEKDFWMCTGGNVPAPLQSIQLKTKKKDGKKYITKVDTATSSFIDFGCNKLMLIMAILAAVIAVAVVATGGAALIAIGALAGAAGAAFGAVLGGLLCGQKAKLARKWLNSKENMIVSGKPAISGDHKMKCMLFGDEITHAPHIKNWWQAIALAGANYVGGILEGMMAGAAIGMGGAFISGGRAAFMQGGTRALGRAGLEFLKTMPKNFGINAVESFSKFGLGMRGVMGAQNTAATYGNTGTAGIGDFAQGTVAMETGAYDSFNNIKEGKGTWQDYVGMAMMVAPVGKGKRELESEINKTGEESVKNANITPEKSRTISEEAEAYEARLGDRRISDDLYNELRDQTPTQDIRNMVNEGITLPMADFALPGLEITKRLHADHIVPMDKITKMEGFDQLTREQQLQVLNNPENFTGLSPSANTSKGPKSFEEWTQHKSKEIQVDPTFREEMITREQQLQGQLQQQIDNFFNN